jgi:broad specificity phosphatase PhoE
LSDREQIDRLRAHLPDKAVLISSDLRRASATANALCGPQHERIAHDPHIREINFGIWDGLHFEEIARRDPVLSRRYWEEPGDIEAPAGESWNAASARVNAAVQRLNARHPDAHIIAVAHFGVILTQLQRALQISAYDTLAHKIDNFSVTRIAWEKQAARVALINHLP